MAYLQGNFPHNLVILGLTVPTISILGSHLSYDIARQRSGFKCEFYASGPKSLDASHRAFIKDNDDWVGVRSFREVQGNLLFME